VWGDGGLRNQKWGNGGHIEKTHQGKMFQNKQQYKKQVVKGSALLGIKNVSQKA